MKFYISFSHDFLLSNNVKSIPFFYLFTSFLFFQIQTIINHELGKKKSTNLWLQLGFRSCLQNQLQTRKHLTDLDEVDLGTHPFIECSTFLWLNTTFTSDYKNMINSNRFPHHMKSWKHHQQPMRVFSYKRYFWESHFQESFFLTFTCWNKVFSSF